MNQSELNWHMKLALEEAQKAWWGNEVPIGAIVVDGYGKILSRASNKKETKFHACDHAEILAINEAGEHLESWRLLDCTLFVTLEPCPMCLYAMVQARIKNLVFGAYDSKGGALSLGYNFMKDKRFNHRFDVMGGVMHYEASKMLSNFFKERRSNYFA